MSGWTGSDFLRKELEDRAVGPLTLSLSPVGRGNEAASVFSFMLESSMGSHDHRNRVPSPQRGEGQGEGADGKINRLLPQ